MLELDFNCLGIVAIKNRQGISTSRVSGPNDVIYTVSEAIDFAIVDLVDFEPISRKIILISVTA